MAARATAPATMYFQAPRRRSGLNGPKGPNGPNGPKGPATPHAPRPNGRAPRPGPKPRRDGPSKNRSPAPGRANHARAEGPYRWANLSANTLLLLPPPSYRNMSRYIVN